MSSCSETLFAELKHQIGPHRLHLRRLKFVRDRFRQIDYEVDWP
jgi:hypothetical protein